MKIRIIYLSLLLSKLQMARLEEFEDFIREKIEKEQWTHVELSSFFNTQYPGERSFSVRTMERFCSDKDIHKITKLSDVDVDECISEAITKVNYPLLHTACHEGY